VTLSEWQAGLSHEHPDRAAASGEYQDVRLRCLVTEHRRPTRDWRPLSLTLSDAAGGSWTFRKAELRAREDGSILIPASLCRRETAYQARIEWSRYQRRPERPDRTWLVRDLPALANRPSRASFGDGFTVQPFTFPEENRRIYIQGVVDQPARGNWFRVEAVDGRGRVISFRHEDTDMMYSSSQPNSVAFGFYVPRGTKKLNLRIAMYRSVFTDFRCKPTWPGE
jgi:hypothetical protein